MRFARGLTPIAELALLAMLPWCCAAQTAVWGAPGISAGGNTPDNWAPTGVPMPMTAYPFDAYLLTPERAGELQDVMDAKSVVRLLPGDYRTLGPASIYLRSGQQLYGLPGTILPEVVVEGDVEGAVLSNLQAVRLRFPASSGVARGNCFNRLVGTPLVVAGGSLEDNLFVAMQITKVSIDNSAGGFLRNNRFVRFTVHAAAPQLVMKGCATPGQESYGNVFHWFNFLTSHGEVVYVDHQRDLSIIGNDSESWNWSLQGGHALFWTGAMGTLRLFGGQGGAISRLNTGRSSSTPMRATF